MRMRFFTCFVLVGILAALFTSAVAQDPAAPQPQAVGGSAAEGPGAPETPAQPPDTSAKVFYVAANGNDTWSGTLPDPSADGSDGPLATLTGARDAIRALRSEKLSPEQRHQGPVTVQIRAGVYRLTEPFALEAQDSGSPGAEVVYMAYPGEKPVISGGRAIGGWKQEGDYWVTEVPECVTSDWRFCSLYVNGARRLRARTPNEGYLHTAGKAPATENPATGEMMIRNTTGFRYNEGDIRRWENLDDALVVVFHAWETSMHHIASIDEENRIVVFRNAAEWPFENWGPTQRYYIENVLEALDAPGEWYLDRQTGKLTYYPMPGEDINTAEVAAPALKQLLTMDGNPSSNQYVQYVRISGLNFQHTDCTVGPEGYGDLAAAVSVPGAIQGRGIRFCAIEDNEVSRVDGYGIWLRVGCYGNSVLRNHLHDLGAGGIRIGERQRADRLDVTVNLVDNNLIHDGGHIYRSGVGIWIGQSALNTITHNTICDLSNSGISIGWAWGGAQQEFSYSNTVESNHIHHLGKANFSNMAGVYVLGGSSNTMVRRNLIHDVISYLYGGWGIHADEGSSNMVIEENLIYNTTSGAFDQFFGNLNRLQNNILAFSADSQLSLSNSQNPTPVLFQRNIVLTNNGLPFGANWDASGIWNDRNCYWDVAGVDIDFGGGTFAEWQALGKDVHSINVDPMFENAAAYDFRLKPESPALALGFRPLDMSQAGIYGAPEWLAMAQEIKLSDIAVSERFDVRPVSEDFENLAAADVPVNATVYGTSAKASVAVTDETAAGGTKSLKFVDSEGPQEPWQPEMCYVPHFREGLAVVSFDIRLEEGAFVQHDWRTDWTPRRVGPRLSFKEGKLTLGTDEKPVMEGIPTGQWFHVEVECMLGVKAPVPASYTVTVTLPGQEPKKFESQACIYRKFRVVERIWFLSAANAATSFCLDNISMSVR